MHIMVCMNAVTKSMSRSERFTKGAKVSITETEYGALEQPETATVFEDYGQSHVNVMRTNGQLHAVPRSSMKPAS